MKDFKTGFMNKLTNDEFAGCFFELISVEQTRMVDNETVLLFLVEAQAMREDMSFVRELNFKHPLTSELNEKVKQRKQGTVLLHGLIRASLNSFDRANRKAADLLLTWFKRLARGMSIYHPSLYNHNALVRNIFYELSLHQELNDAIEQLGLQHVLENLEKITNEIMEIVSERRNQKTENSHKAIEIRKRAFATLRDLLRAVEVQVAIEKRRGGTLYHTYARQLHDALKVYRTTYLARNTRHKNAAKKIEEEAHKVPMEDVQATTTPDKPKSIEQESVHIAMRTAEKRDVSTSKKAISTRATQSAGEKSSKETQRPSNEQVPKEQSQPAEVVKELLKQSSFHLHKQLPKEPEARQANGTIKPASGNGAFLRKRPLRQKLLENPNKEHPN